MEHEQYLINPSSQLVFRGHRRISHLRFVSELTSRDLIDLAEVIEV